MTITLLRLIPLPDRRQDILEILLSIIGPTLAEPGCGRCEVAGGVLDDSILLIEEWKTEADLTRHLRSSLYARVLAAVEFSAAPPEVRFLDVARSRGLELVEGVRLAAPSR